MMRGWAVSDSNMLALLRGSRWRWGIALFVVPAILICMVAMDVLMTRGPNDSGQSHAMVTHTSDTAMVAAEVAAASSSHERASAEFCGGLCDSSGDMLGMLCVFALLVTGGFLMLRLILLRWEMLRRIVTSLAVKAVALPPPTAPSLHILSISRT